MDILLTCLASALLIGFYLLFGMLIWFPEIIISQDSEPIESEIKNTTIH